MPKFLRKECSGCKMCILACPDGCIEGAEKNTYDFDLSFCKGCGLCAAVCPKKDIEMVKEESEDKSKEKKEV